ncbi:MAG: DUF721 domain-containing protein [Sphingobium sp.]
MKRPVTERPIQPGPPKAKDAPKERARIGAPRAIADIIPDIGQAAFRRFGFVQASIVSRWNDIAGAHYAAICEPEMIRFPAGTKAGGTLHLIVMGGHAPMLQHSLPEIIDKVNRFFGYGAVAKVTMRQGQLSRRPPERRPPPANLKPLPQDIGDSLRAIGDPELRTVLEAFARGFPGSSGPPRIG